MRKVSLEHYEEVVAEFKDMEKRLEKREKIALNLADQLNLKIDECEKLKEELAHFKYLYKVASSPEETKR